MNHPVHKQFGRYRIVETIGAGAMGDVYRARDERLARDVAIKTIRTVGVGEFQREVYEARFNNEARALAAMSHPHIVPIFDMGIEDAVPYLVMEHLPGRSLKDRLETTGQLTAPEARALLVQLAGALTAAHNQNILHRDVKPANILESDSGTWKLADFGIAHTPDSTVTLTGQFLGSPAYAAPEALQRGEFSAASDLYGLSATVYESLTGALPFGDRGLLTPGALTDNREASDLRHLRSDVPGDLATVIMQGLLRDPERRLSGPAIIRAVSTAQPAVPLATAIDTPTLAASAITPLMSRHSRTRWFTLGGLALALVAGISIGVCSTDEQGSVSPAMKSERGPTNLAAPQIGETATDRRAWLSPERSARSAKRWAKAQQKLDKGDTRGAERELRKLLSDQPNDHEARALLRTIPASGHRERGGKKHKKHGKRHR